MKLLPFRNTFRCVAVLAAALPLCAAGQTTVAGDPLTGSGSVTRTLLTYTTLMASTQPTVPVNDSAYAVPSGAAAPIDTFQGTLTLTAPTTTGNYTSVYDPLLYSSANSQWKHMPTFSFQFVQNGSWFIPVKQGWQVTGSSYWNIILGPGRAWTETSDNGYTRVALPFSLVEYNQNCVHQGEMTFLFSSTKSPTISNVSYQVTTETCAYWHFYMYGMLGATYTPATISNATDLQNAMADEIANRIPVKAFSAIATDYPSSGFNAAAFTSEFGYPADIRSYGVYLNGVNYVAGCTTRYGTYAFCSEMRFPSYSVAKTAFVSLALGKLGKDYGTSVYSELIKTWLPTYYTAGGTWTNVTFQHTADMATGNYTSSAFEVDENGSVETTNVINVVPYTTKINNSFRYWPNKTTPGTTWVYHTHDAFIQTAAMQNYLQNKTGSTSADLANYLGTNIYSPLKLSAGAMNVMRTDNAQSSTTTTGYPIGSYGMFFNQDDAVKLGNFMNAGSGVINGTQVIDPTHLQETLFRSSRSGMQVPDDGFYSSTPPVANTNHYQDDVWQKTYTPTEYSTLTCSFNVPYMSGYGGVTVAMLPNGAVYYMFADGGEFYQDNAVVEIAKLAPMCPATAVTLDATQLSFSSSTVAPITQTLTLYNPNNSTMTLNVPTLSGGDAAKFAVSTYCSTLAAKASCPMTITYTPVAAGNASATLTVPTKNSYIIGSTITANASSTVSLLAYAGPDRAVPAITWATPAPIAYGTALSATQLNATTPVAGTFVYTPASGTVLAAGNQTLSVTFTPTDLATYSIATQTVTLQVVPVVTSLSWTPSRLQVATGSALGAGVLNATSTTPGSISYTATLIGGSPVTVNSATVLATGTYTLTATLVPSDANYATATLSKTLTVATQNVWVVNGNGTLSSLTADGIVLNSGVSAGGVAVAADAAGSLWSLAAGGLSKTSNGGRVISSGYTGGGLAQAAGLAVDGEGKVWIANANNSISLFANDGTALTPTSGYASDAGLSTPSGIAVDNAGNVWVTNSADDSVEEIVGAAAPVAPLAIGVQNQTTGVKP